MKFTFTFACLFFCFSCFNSSSLNAQCYGGQIFTNGNVTTIDLCTTLPNASQPLYTNGSVQNYDFVLTDENNVITAFLDGNTISLDEVSENSTRIWGFSYTGNRIATVGQIVWGLPYSDECYSISSNAIFVNSIEVDGGQVSNEAGTDEIFVCTNDNVPDVIGFFNNSNSTGKYAYIITAEDNTVIFVTENSYLDFGLISLGKCKIWGVSYTGNLTLVPELNLIEAEQGEEIADGCADLSDNFITVEKEYVVGGFLFDQIGQSHVFIEVGDGNPDVVEFVTNSWAAPNYAYVITDVTNTILEITAENSKDFDSTGPGICRVWGFSYTGDILVGPGDQIFGTQFSSGCFDITTTAIQIERTGEPTTGGNVEGGVVGLDGGGSFAVLCPDAPGENEVAVSNDSEASENYTYIITDENNSIVTFTVTSTIFLSAFLPGTYRIYGVSHIGELNFEQGDDVTATSLSNMPFEVSDNYVTIVVSIPEAAELAANIGGDGLICAGLEGVDIMSVGDIVGNIDYYIVDENNIVIAIDENSPVSIPEGVEGVVKIYGVTHFDELTVGVGDEFTGSLSDGCYDISDNFIEVNGTVEVDGGFVSLITGMTSIGICVGDNVPDNLIYQNDTNSDADYGYVITDDMDNILAFIIGNETDFDAAISGVYRVYGYSFTGNIAAFPGDPITAVLTDGCYELSENFITVDAAATFGGVIFLEDESSATVLCAGGENNTINILVNTTSPADYAFVMTDAFGIIYDIFTETTYTFDADLPANQFFIAGYSYIGDLLSPIGESIVSAQIATGCFQQSITFIEVNFDEIDAGEIATLDGNTEEVLCIADDVEDVLTFQNNTAFSGDYTYLLTAPSGEILDILPLGNPSYDFENLEIGNYVVFGLAYTGDLLAQVGDNFEVTNLSVSCYALSNPLFVQLVDDGAACEPLIIGEDPENRLVEKTDVAKGNTLKWTVSTAPNPIENEVNIQLTNLELNTTISQLKITDLSGRLIYQTAITNSQSININTENWNTGIYFLTFVSENEVITEKLLKR